MDKRWNIAFRMLALMAFTVLIAVLLSPDKNLHLITCDVGQGDAILATLGKTQILIDGGPGSSVLNCLSNHIPFWDRRIELVVITHPQTDHFTGLIDVFERYRVDTVVANSLDSGSQEYKVLKNAVGGSGARVINPNTGMKLRLGLMYLDIAWPAKEFVRHNSTQLASEAGSNVLGATVSKRDPNDFSIVSILTFGQFDVLLTGDIGPDVTGDILTAGKIRDVEYLKVPHHGSKNGLTEELLKASRPEIAVISVGKNSYGHPSGEVIKLLSDKAIKFYRTDEEGDVEMVSDGEKYWLQ